MTTSHPKPVTNHAWTTHGHPCCRQPGPTVGTQPDTVARCGGPGICTECATQATQTHGQTEPEPAADDTKTEPAPDQNRCGIRLELIETGTVFTTGCLHGPTGQHHPINLPPQDWEALETALTAAARYPVPAVATDLLDMVAEALRPHLSLVEDQDECWEVTVEGASGLADVAIEALISAARLPGVADEHVMFEYRLARDQVARFAERINTAEAERDAMRPVVEAARDWRHHVGDYPMPASDFIRDLIAAVDALDGTP